MNEHFNSLSVSSADVDIFIEKVTRVQEHLVLSKQDLAVVWEGGSCDHLLEAIDSEDGKLNSLLGNLREMQVLLDAIHEHQAVEKQRDQARARVGQLRGELYYTVYDDETGESHQRERAGVRAEIERWEQRIEDFNQMLNELVLRIDSITLG